MSADREAGVLDVDAAPRRSKAQRAPLLDRLGDHALVIVATQVMLTVVVLAAWQWLVSSGVLQESRYGTPAGIGAALTRLIREGELWPNLVATLNATAIGFVIGSVLGIVLGLLLGSIPFADRVFAPLIAILNAMPRIAFAPLLILWFGLTIWAKVWMAASLCVFILLLNARSAAIGVNRDFIMLSKVNELSWPAFFWKIVLPSAMPAIFAGLRLSVVYALLGVIASEMIVSRNGLGLLVIRFSSTTIDINALFAVLIVIALLAALLNVVIGRGERRLLRWQ